MSVLNADRIRDAMNEIRHDPDHIFECSQVAITGADQCAILFEVADSDYNTQLSLVFLVDNFDPSHSRLIFSTEEWLFSLSATSLAGLSALDVGRDIWTGAPDNWQRANAANWFNTRVWCFEEGSTFLIGEEGQSSRFDGAGFEPISPGRTTLLYDIHGLQEDSIYSVGSAGTLQRLTKAGWRPIDLHRSDRFRGIDASRPKRLRICGDNGLCLEVRDEGEVVPIEAPDGIFFCVREFKGEVYWGCSQFGVYRQRDLTLEEFHETAMAYDFRCDERFLYSVGTDMAWRFDGDDWKSVQLRYEDGEFTLN